MCRLDLKTAARKYTDLQVEASLQLSIYSYATAMNGLADCPVRSRCWAWGRRLVACPPWTRAESLAS